jgi:hypothetical protein
MSYGGQATFGINFRNQGNAQWAVEHMRGIDEAVGINHPAILAYEIGNEVSDTAQHTPPLPVPFA